MLAIFIIFYRSQSHDWFQTAAALTLGKRLSYRSERQVSGECHTSIIHVLSWSSQRVDFYAVHLYNRREKDVFFDIF